VCLFGPVIFLFIARLPLVRWDAVFRRVVRRLGLSVCRYHTFGQKSLGLRRHLSLSFAITYGQANTTTPPF
jgi:hypothetical protein